MRTMGSRSFLVRLLLLLLVTGLSCASLLIGQRFTTAEAGQRAPEAYVAENDFSIEDEARTEQLRAEAAAAVAPVYRRDESVDQLVIEEIRSLFRGVKEDTVPADAQPLPVVTTSTTLAPPTTAPATTAATTTTTSAPADDSAEGAAPDETGAGEGETPPEEGAPETTAAGEDGEPASPPVTEQAQPAPGPTIPDIVRSSGISGRVFVDVGLNVTYDEDPDAGLGDVRLVAYDSAGDQYSANTSPRGSFILTGLAPGPATLLVDTSTVPDRLTTTSDRLLRTVELPEGGTLALDPLPLWMQITPRQTRLETLRTGRHLLPEDAIVTLVDLAERDVLREILGQQSWLDLVEQETARLAGEALAQNGGIANEELSDVKQDYRLRTVLVQLPDADPEMWRSVSGVVTQVATELLQANKTVDDAETERLRAEASDAVEPAMIEYEAGTVIVEAGAEITEEDMRLLQAAGALGLAAPGYIALAVVVMMVVGLLWAYLMRFRPMVWGSLRRLSLVGLLIVLVALSARSAALFTDANPALGFLVPAAAFGLMSAILFDARIAVLFAVTTGSMTAIATLDPAYALFALLSTLAPVLFVSAISARGALRMAVLYMVVMLGALAGGIAWFFQVDANLLTVIGIGALNGFASGLLGSALLSFLEIAFDLTTSLRLLDLTDRNHPALRLLEEKAPGTFNHSLLVGTLADRAARAIGADPLLARAAAYYHDLGKTRAPYYFIENQGGTKNPHDDLPPEHSAEVIRSHVEHGVELARRYRIPSEVAAAVRTHHGDGVMHFFYDKAVEMYGAEAVNVEDYRHTGSKPVRKEMALVMMADSVEAACRATFEKEDPTVGKITDLVERVVGVKVSDGQLSESELTLGDLTVAKEAMVDALASGHYHPRIDYPNFPKADGSPVVYESGEYEMGEHETAYENRGDDW